MKKLVAGIMIVAICCVSAPVGAQQGRERAYRQGRQDQRGQQQRRRQYRGGRWYNDPVPGIVGGLIGGWLGSQQANRPDAEPVRDAAWCAQRYKSYDWYTKTYLGYDGLRHGCP